MKIAPLDNLSLCLYFFFVKSLQEQQSERLPQYDSLMTAMVTKMDPQLQRKVEVLSEKWNRLQQQNSNYHKL